LRVAAGAGEATAAADDGSSGAGGSGGSGVGRRRRRVYDLPISLKGRCKSGKPMYEAKITHTLPGEKGSKTGSDLAALVEWRADKVVT
jgi:hypothetical protein